jgi:hypothetical protein
MGLLLVRDVMVTVAFRSRNRYAIERCGGGVRGCESQTYPITRWMAEDGFTRHHLGRAGGHLTVVIEAVYQQFVTAGTGAAADDDGTRVEPVLDLGVNRDAQLRARWREEY